MNDRNETVVGFLCVVMVIGAVAGLVLGVGGFETIEANQYGLKIDVFTKDIDPVTKKGGGIHFVGINYDYLRFPATWQTVDFTPDPMADDIPINTQTKDGLAITFDASFQYRLIPENLSLLYSEYGTAYNDAIVERARGSLRNTAGRFSATEFLQNRSGVADVMRVDLHEAVNDMYIIVEYFQLRAITLPENFMNATSQVEIAKLQQTISQYELEAALIEAQKLLVEAQAAANVSLVEAEAAANVSIVQAIAGAEAYNITLGQESESLAFLQSELGLNGTDMLVYLYVKALENLPDGTTLVMSDFISMLLQA